MITSGIIWVNAPRLRHWVLSSTAMCLQIDTHTYQTMITSTRIHGIGMLLFIADNKTQSPRTQKKSDCRYHHSHTHVYIILTSTATTTKSIWRDTDSSKRVERRSCAINQHTKRENWEEEEMGPLARQKNYHFLLQTSLGK